MRCARVVALVACRVLLVVVGSSWDEVGKKVQHLDVRAEVPASVACLCFARELPFSWKRSSNDFFDETEA